MKVGMSSGTVFLLGNCNSQTYHEVRLFSLLHYFIRYKILCIVEHCYRMCHIFIIYGHRCHRLIILIKVCISCRGSTQYKYHPTSVHSIDSVLSISRSKAQQCSLNWSAWYWSIITQLQPLSETDAISVNCPAFVRDVQRNYASNVQYMNNKPSMQFRRISVFDQFCDGMRYLRKR